MQLIWLLTSVMQWYAVYLFWLTGQDRRFSQCHSQLYLFFYPKCLFNGSLHQTMTLKRISICCARSLNEVINNFVEGMKAAWYFHHPSSIFDLSFTTFFILLRVLFVWTKINLMEPNSKNGSVSWYKVTLDWKMFSFLPRSELFRTFVLINLLHYSLGGWPDSCRVYIDFQS